MHCETTIDPEATWRESWRALERAYAEGRVLSIGVSNFNTHLLHDMLSNVATVLPHIVQNWAEPGQVDSEVRAWCERYGVLYQPYAPLRNIQHLPMTIRQTLQAIAQRYDITEQAAVLQFFIQTGAVVIPRSTSWHHLRANIEPSLVTFEQDEMKGLGWSTTQL